MKYIPDAAFPRIPEFSGFIQNVVGEGLASVSFISFLEVLVWP